MPDPIHFYFDFSSSYSYFAYDVIGEIARKHGRELVRRPVALGAVFKDNNHAPPMPDTVKGKYIYHDVERQAALLGKPYKWPTPFPYNSIHAARGFYWLEGHDEALLEPYMAAVFETAFGRGEAADNPDSLAGIADAIGADAQGLKEGVSDPAIKTRLIEETQAAQGKGVFGAPSFVVGDELFWGSDRLSALDAWLGKQSG